ncbi:MAG: DNA mismatch repair endonuclease MutL [Candidatus Absconditabacterales bacterium]
MAIRKLPEYLVDRLKTGEIIERPATVIKELVENSLDAGANTIQITIHDGGKSFISVEDDGSGIELSDMDFLFERYTTSKIYGEQDLFNLNSYGFRGEALANISKVSKTTIISKTEYSEIGTKITKVGMDPIIKHQPVGFAHGTIVIVQDLFYNVSEKLKSLKSSQTEFFYCYNYIVDIAIMYPNKTFVFKKNDKVVFNLQPKDTLIERITDIYKKDRSKHSKQLQYIGEEISLSGVVGDTQVSFGSPENIKIYINKRPIQDKGLIKVITDVYNKKLLPNEYPLAILMIDTKPNFVDVNRDPKKLEVKFTDARKVCDIVYSHIQEVLGGQKISTASNISVSDIEEIKHTAEIIRSPSNEQEQLRDKEIGEYKIIGQIRNSYIILESQDTMYYIDQYALAERILVEKIKSWVKTTSSPSSEILLQPITIPVAIIPNLDHKLDKISSLGFDTSMIGENKIAIYSVPEIFSMYKIDMEKVFNEILYIENITFDTILDKIFSTHACKVSIKAGDRLSFTEMVDLIKDGFASIPGFFLGHYDRPFLIKTEKKDIDTFFDK